MSVSWSSEGLVKPLSSVQTYLTAPQLRSGVPPFPNSPRGPPDFYCTFIISSTYDIIWADTIPISILSAPAKHSRLIRSSISNLCRSCNFLWIAVFFLLQSFQGIFVCAPPDTNNTVTPEKRHTTEKGNYVWMSQYKTITNALLLHP